MGPRTTDRIEKCVDVLRDIVVTGSLPELAHAAFVVGERLASDFVEIGFRHEYHDAAGSVIVNGRGPALRAVVQSTAVPPAVADARLDGEPRV